jgi:hypothetical protein
MRILRRDRLGGLIHEYSQVAWRDAISGTFKMQSRFNLDETASRQCSGVAAVGGLDRSALPRRLLSGQLRQL